MPARNRFIMNGLGSSCRIDWCTKVTNCSKAAKELKRQPLFYFIYHLRYSNVVSVSRVQIRVSAAIETTKVYSCVCYQKHCAWNILTKYVSRCLIAWHDVINSEHEEREKKILSPCGGGREGRNKNQHYNVCSLLVINSLIVACVRVSYFNV